MGHGLDQLWPYLMAHVHSCTHTLEQSQQSCFRVTLEQGPYSVSSCSVKAPKLPSGPQSFPKTASLSFQRTLTVPKLRAWPPFSAAVLSHRPQGLICLPNLFTGHRGAPGQGLGNTAWVVLWPCSSPAVALWAASSVSLRLVCHFKVGW